MSSKDAIKKKTKKRQIFFAEEFYTMTGAFSHCQEQQSTMQFVEVFSHTRDHGELVVAAEALNKY